MADVHEINSLDQLAGIRLLWNYLLPETPSASFFHTYEWLETYWRHYGRGQRLRALVVHSCGKPIGIVPLCVREQRYRVGKVRVLSYPLDDWGMWYGPIGPNPAASLVLAMQHVRHTRRDWDMIDLRWTRRWMDDGGRTARAMRIAGMEPRRRDFQTTSVVDIEGTWDDFLASRTGKRRSEFRRVLRRTFEQGEVQFVRHRPIPARLGGGDPRWDLYDMCETVAANSWQSEVKTGNTLCSERVRGFLRDAHRQAARLGMVDINLLIKAGQPVAFAYNYHHQGNVFGLRTGFDGSAPCQSAGIALILRSLKDSFDRGDSQIDMGIGDWAFKRRIRTGSLTSQRLTHAPIHSLKSQAVRLVEWSKARFGQQPEKINKPASA